MREIERLYTTLISWGLHKFKDDFNLADKDERMRKGGKGEMGETSYILIIPVVFGWWHRERVCVCVWWGSSPLAPPPQRGARAEEQSWRASMQSPAILSRAEFSWGRPGASRGLHFPFQLLCHSHKDLQSKRIMGNAGVKLINLIPFILAYKLAICLHLDNIINAAYCWKLKCVVTIIHQFWICWIPILQPAYLYP